MQLYTYNLLAFRFMERVTLKKALKTESPTNNGWLDSPLVSFLDELSSRLYFWVNRNVIERGGYDINNDNGPLINSVLHAVFKLRKAVPTAKELRQAGLLNLQGMAKIGQEYVKSFFESGRIQSFQDEYGNEYCGLNLHLADPSIESVIKYIQNTDQQIEIVLGNCSKGHLPHETKGLDGVHVCEYRVKPNCFYNSKMGDKPNITRPFAICADTPCLVGTIHKQVNKNKNLITHGGCNFSTILGGFQTFREIPGFFEMNTNEDSSKFIIWGTCHFSIPYLIQAARMFPNVKGVAIAYMNGCQTLGDRVIRLRGERRDKHITRFKGPTTINGNPISRMIKGKIH